MQSFVFLGLLVFELEPMYATSDRRTTDADDRLMPPPPPLRGGGIINGTGMGQTDRRGVTLKQCPKGGLLPPRGAANNMQCLFLTSVCPSSVLKH